MGWCSLYYLVSVFFFGPGQFFAFPSHFSSSLSRTGLDRHARMVWLDGAKRGEFRFLGTVESVFSLYY